MAQNSIENPILQDPEDPISPEEQARREEALEAENNLAGDNNPNNARVVERQRAERANREATGKTDEVKNAIYDEHGKLIAKPASWENPNGEDLGEQEVLLTFEQTKAIQRAIENGQPVPDFSNQAVKNREYVPGTELVGSDENGQHKPPQAAPAAPAATLQGTPAPPPPPPAANGKPASTWAPK